MRRGGVRYLPTLVNARLLASNLGNDTSNFRLGWSHHHRGATARLAHGGQARARTNVTAP
ncbi:hypothetical protein BN903_25 [Halorubrum sp. AJ67]|nr:hypothetical protein BN903_25 [Halorubrum sp. AJ67]